MLVEFAHTLNFLSPSAYKYARKYMCLPHKETLRRWQTVDGQAGWTAESFKALKDDNNKRDCVVVMDGVHIKASCQWSQGLKRFVGYEDIGISSVQDCETLATEATVFMAVGIIRAWKLPLAYFLTKGSMSGDQQSNLLREATCRLADVGVQVRTVVFDGAPGNIATVNKLGAQLPDTPFFNHPSTAFAGAVIWTVVDSPHMLKLSRNCLATHALVDSRGDVISWDHITGLLALQQSEGVKFANKLSPAHVTEWKKRKMKVKLAAQVMSTSVADALQLLMDIQLPEFQSSSATIRFIRMVDKVFDKLNSRSPFIIGSKQAITRNGIDEDERFFKEVEKELRALRLFDGQTVITSKSKCFVIGFITTMRATIGLARELFQQFATHELWYFIPYRLCQDALEHFFGDIRARNGWCNNPTALQFMFSYRALLSNRFHLQGLSGGRNCIELVDDGDDVRSTS